MRQKERIGGVWNVGRNDEGGMEGEFFVGLPKATETFPYKEIINLFIRK
jgi:hypothetical protein